MKNVINQMKKAANWRVFWKLGVSKYLVRILQKYLWKVDFLV